jgi:lipopolysaccharide transport system ATP-binding protein
MKPLISFENVSVHFPVSPAPPKIEEGKSVNARAMLRRLAYRGRSESNRSVALRNIWLTVNEGERLAIMGLNGSGKSTLLRVMCGAIPHYQGRITVFGETAAILSVSAGFQPSASGYENIFLRGLMLGMSRSEIERRLPEIIKFTALGDALYQPVSTYSSGMTLRLAFAITTCITPDILIMDEWIGVGDTRFLEAARARMQTIVTSSRILILASHNEKILREFCTHAVLLHEGQIIFRGTIDEVCRYYGEFNALVRSA